MRDADPRASRAEVGAADLLHAARAPVDRELAGQPRVRLELLTIIGESYYGLRDNAEAAGILEQALHEALEAPDTEARLVVHLRRLLSQSRTRFSVATRMRGSRASRRPRRIRVGRSPAG